MCNLKTEEELNLPEGYEVKEVEDFIFIVRDGKEVAILGKMTSLPQIKREVIRHFNGTE